MWLHSLIIVNFNKSGTEFSKLISIQLPSIENLIALDSVIIKIVSNICLSVRHIDSIKQASVLIFLSKFLTLIVSLKR